MDPYDRASGIYKEGRLKIFPPCCRLIYTEPLVGVSVATGPLDEPRPIAPVPAREIDAFLAVFGPEQEVPAANIELAPHLVGIGMTGPGKDRGTVGLRRARHVQALV